MRLHRLIAILLLMESRGSIKAKEMAAALETSERTIYRDIDILCEAGLPIMASTGPTGGFSFMQGYSVSLKNFHYDDAISLFLSGIGIRPEGDSEAGLKLKSALAKLERNLPAEYRDDIKAARERFYFEPDDWWKEKQPLIDLEVVRQGVWRSTKIAIEYCKVNGETQRRVVCPYGLVVKNGDWYLVAYCEMSQDIRIFKCERIRSARHLDEKFTIPEDFVLERFWRANTEAFKASCRAKDRYPVRLRLTDQVDVNSLQKFGQVVDQHVDPCGQRIVCVNAFSYGDAYRSLLEKVDQIEVLDPQELRADIIRKLRGAYALYRMSFS